MLLQMKPYIVTPDPLYLQEAHRMYKGYGLAK